MRLTNYKSHTIPNLERVRKRFAVMQFEDIVAFTSTGLYVVLHQKNKKEKDVGGPSTTHLSICSEECSNQTVIKNK